MNSLSFSPTTTVNSEHLNECHNWKPMKYFMLSISENCWNINVPLTGGSWRKSATVTTEKSANVLFRHKHFFQPWISIHSLMSSYHRKFISISKHFTYDNLFFKAALDLSLKQSNFVPSLIPRPEWKVVPPLFSADKPVSLSKRPRRFLDC